MKVSKLEPTRVDNYTYQRFEKKWKKICYCFPSTIGYHKTAYNYMQVSVFFLNFSQAINLKF